MYIGEAAKITGLSIKAIRLYEHKGLIKAPIRQGRYRTYNVADIEILSLIAQAKTLGVTLAKLKDVIVYHQGEIDWQRINRFLIEIKHQLSLELAVIANNIEQVEKCIASIDSCPTSLDSAPKGRR